MELAVALWILLALQIGLGITIFAVSKRLWSHLAAHHAVVWEELGRPGSSLGAGDRDGIRRFLRAKEYRALEDPQVERWARRIQGLNALFLPLAIATLALGIAVGMELQG